MLARLLPLVVLVVAVGEDRARAGETEVVFEEGGLAALGITPVGKRRRIPTFEHTARRNVRGTPDLTSIETVTVVGGVIFVERARPATSGLECPTVGIDLGEESGGRLRVDFEEERVAGTLYDWEIVPLVAFVRSGSDGLFTYMGAHGEYHEAFADNLAGFNLFLLDTIRSVKRPSQAHLAVATRVPGYTEDRGVDPTSRQAARRLKRWMGNRHLMFTDLEVDFVFRPENGGLVIDGEPYWIAVASRMNGTSRIIGRFDDHATTRAANPAIFGSGTRLAKYASFFRYLKADCDAQWRALDRSIAASRAELDLYTIPPSRMPYAVR